MQFKGVWINEISLIKNVQHAKGYNVSLQSTNNSAYKHGTKLSNCAEMIFSAEFVSLKILSVKQIQIGKEWRWKGSDIATKKSRFWITIFTVLICYTY